MNCAGRVVSHACGCDTRPVRYFLMSTTTPNSLQSIARRARVRGVRVCLYVTVVLAAIASFLSGSIAAEGLLLGGIAGALGFWTMSLRLERVALVRPDKLTVVATVWTFYRLAVYGAFLFIAYRLDPDHLRGFFGGVAGLLSTRLALTFLAVRDARAAMNKQASP